VYRTYRICKNPWRQTIWRSIKARLDWRASPFHSSDDKTDEGHGVHFLERIRAYSLDGYTLFWMKKGVVEPWMPADRWETPPSREVKYSPETELFLWIARIVDKIECEGRLKDSKTEGTRHNPYREAILDDVCMKAFGSKHPHNSGYPFRTGPWWPVRLLVALRADQTMRDL
jgi:hypothetical protein